MTSQEPELPPPPASTHYYDIATDWTDPHYLPLFKSPQRIPLIPEAFKVIPPSLARGKPTVDSLKLKFSAARLLKPTNDENAPPPTLESLAQESLTELLCTSSTLGTPPPLEIPELSHVKLAMSMGKIKLMALGTSSSGELANDLVDLEEFDEEDDEDGERERVIEVTGCALNCIRTNPLLLVTSLVAWIPNRVANAPFDFTTSRVRQLVGGADRMLTKAQREMNAEYIVRLASGYSVTVGEAIATGLIQKMMGPNFTCFAAKRKAHSIKVHIGKRKWKKDANDILGVAIEFRTKVVVCFTPDGNKVRVCVFLLSTDSD